MIMRDVNSGWAVRYIHSNVASFFFIFVYAQSYYLINLNNFKSSRVVINIFIYFYKSIEFLRANLIKFGFSLTILLYPTFQWPCVRFSLPTPSSNI
jgi:ubiquinol-cytochrome c reductase cytochrome b subunit